MFILHPDPYCLPSYRIGPFTTKDLSTNRNLKCNDKIDHYLNERFGNQDYIYTKNGRQALYLALDSLNLKNDDIVTVLTTSGNLYISGCVTSEIEKFCRWNREISPQTKAILLNHEFGFPYEEVEKLKALGLPIIEDCAHTFFSKGVEVNPGSIGDFVVYSFPKMFPLQIGGLLVCSHFMQISKKNVIEDALLQHIKSVLSTYIENKNKIIEKRLSNYNYLKSTFLELGFSPRFQMKKGTVPGVFMFKTEGHSIDLPELKNHFYAHGVQCSVFYGEEAFFIPVHQALVQDDLDYFVAILKAYLQRGSQ